MISQLQLTDFRSHAATRLAAGAGLIAVSGPNGAGKTNLLEAISLLSPGRGLRRAALGAMAREGGAGGFAVAARLDTGAGEPVEIGTGIDAGSARRMVRINGSPTSAAALSEWLSVLWLTPAMDRLFTGPAADRRRFLDRLTLALFPGHGQAATRYEAAMRERNRLIADDRTGDGWLGAVEIEMGTYGTALAQQRAAAVQSLSAALAGQDGPFPSAALTIDGHAWGHAAELTAALATSRRNDIRAGRTLVGPHRDDLIVRHAEKEQEAARASTGEQKALLIGIVLAHAGLVMTQTERRPVLLLDEVAAHLDEARRAALFGLLNGLGAQIWMTGTDAALFRDMPGAATHVDMTGGAPVVRV
ncbi:DNA replication/repair protein RecF [Pacificimonas sp. WHA3]|uniref:DNA replication and repair protein RecF n=1 Tax=Pacificimonas pallii TaxID=2827236 RepID=A0ABS6SGJ6_9SPHN|nr:DNA replication/repair protein RecF [Pacificimonas pallii]